MKTKIIKTEADYQQALIRVEELMDSPAGTSDEEELELLAILVENYEKEHFPIDWPDPVEAILFRMEQQNLTRKDLEKYIGSQSKVSEVLNRKIPLSLNMIRALNSGLGIPFEVLLKEPEGNQKEHQYNFRNYPFSEMVKRGYFKSFNGSVIEAKPKAGELISSLFVVFQGNNPQRVFCRTSAGQPDENALAAWQARAMEMATLSKLPKYEIEHFNLMNIRDIVKLSGFSSGPLLAKEYLEKHGIALVILAHLPNTYLDGACFRSPSGTPIIGLTLRHNRVDNFWFTLVHELVHLVLHLNVNNIAFFDDLEQGISEGCNAQEEEAKNRTIELLIPEKIWNREKDDLSDKNKIIAFAQNLDISPAIIAGRVRWEKKDYTVFTDLIGSGTVKKLFYPEN